jgi:toxin ParE1/3/4
MTAKRKPVVPRARAHEDVDEAVTFYIEQGAAQAALGFIDALEKSFTQIARHPDHGSLRHAHELGIAGLRCHTMKRYPHLVFYVDRGDHIDVWRVLHARRDIAAWLGEE